MKTPPILPSVLAICGVIILCALGTWQAKKYIAKTTNANSEVCSQNSILELTESFHDIGEIRGQLCRDKIVLHGRLDTLRVISLGPRVHDGEVGYHIYAILKGSDASNILVNMGWNKEAIDGLVTSDGSAVARSYAVTGVLVEPSERNMFTLDNNPEGNEWYNINVDEIAKHWDVENLSPYILFAQDVNIDAALSLIPAELSKTYLKPKTHLQYAAFWYFMALALIVIFALRFMRGQS